MSTELSFFVDWLNNKGVFYFIEHVSSLKHDIIHVANLESEHEYTFTYDDEGMLIEANSEWGVSLELFANDRFVLIVGVDDDNDNFFHVYGFSDHKLHTTYF